jgi:hypothetical protein
VRALDRRVDLHDIGRPEFARDVLSIARLAWVPAAAARMMPAASAMRRREVIALLQLGSVAEGAGSIPRPSD